jgi:hypothetical protein
MSGAGTIISNVMTDRDERGLFVVVVVVVVVRFILAKRYTSGVITGMNSGVNKLVFFILNPTTPSSDFAKPTMQPKPSYVHEHS